MLNIVILAAGNGKRMRSSLPKVLHLLGGTPMIERVVRTSQTLTQNTYIVHSPQAQQIQAQLQNYPLTWIEQTEQLGTGHAILQALPQLKAQTSGQNDRVLTLYGDVPLITPQTLQHLIDQTPTDHVGMITVHLADPTGFGRVLRDHNGHICGIVEQKDATAEQLTIKEVNTGIFLLPLDYLQKWLPQLTNNNAQGEYYLTDIIALAVANNVVITSINPPHIEEVLGINDRLQLIQLERYFQRQQAEKLLCAGVTIMDPERFDVRGDLQCGTDTTIDVNVIFEGRVTLGSNCIIEANCILRNITLGDNVHIKANCVLEDAVIEANCKIGPFARVRPGTHLAANCRLGNFVELKNSKFAEGSKADHLSYIGDADVGKHVTIGAGTITCNYDGVNKYRTKIGDGVFIGSDSQLVAPVSIGAGAYIAAGSTITADAPADALTICRARQTTIEGWQRPKKNAG